jgi:hypothetical protein
MEWAAAFARWSNKATVCKVHADAPQQPNSIIPGAYTNVVVAYDTIWPI